jgi:hypothetical protein
MDQIFMLKEINSFKVPLFLLKQNQKKLDLNLFFPKNLDKSQFLHLN